MTEWVRTYVTDFDYIESLDGVLWADAPLPPRKHQCQPQTRVRFGVSYIERCACGANRLSERGGWLAKNETRNYRERRAGVGDLPRRSWLQRLTRRQHA